MVFVVVVAVDMAVMVVTGLVVVAREGGPSIGRSGFVAVFLSLLLMSMLVLMLVLMVVLVVVLVLVLMLVLLVEPVVMVVVVLVARCGPPAEQNDEYRRTPVGPYNTMTSTTAMTMTQTTMPTLTAAVVAMTTGAVAMEEAVVEAMTAGAGVVSSAGVHPSPPQTSSETEKSRTTDVFTDGFRGALRSATRQRAGWDFYVVRRVV